MKYTKIILAAILAFTLTACSDAGTAEVTEEITESSVSETVSEVTTTEVTTTEETATATETETTVSETEEKDLIEEPEIDVDISGSHKLAAGMYDVNCIISTSNWYGDEFEFSNSQMILINRFLTGCNSDELQSIISSGAEHLMMENIPAVINASLDDLYFFDCNGDGKEEMLCVLELYDISDGFGNTYAVYYIDDINVNFVFSGAHMHRSVFFAEADNQPFIISAEFVMMGYGGDPVVEAQKAFTFSDGNFIPYSPPEGKSLCVRVSSSGNSLYLFNTDTDNDTGYYYMDEIANGDIKQTLIWTNGSLKVIEGFEAE